MTDKGNEGFNKPLNHINFETGSFMANGKEYRVQGALSAERFVELQLIKMEYGTGSDLAHHFQSLIHLKDLMNKLRFVDAAVKLNDIIIGTAELEKREPQILKICALVCNTADENREIITTDMIQQKVEDFLKSGIDINDFFYVASGLLKEYLKTLNNYTLSISDMGITK